MSRTDEHRTQLTIPKGRIRIYAPTQLGHHPVHENGSLFWEDLQGQSPIDKDDSKAKHHTDSGAKASRARRSSESHRRQAEPEIPRRPRHSSLVTPRLETPVNESAQKRHRRHTTGRAAGTRMEPSSPTSPTRPDSALSIQSYVFVDPVSNANAEPGRKHHRTPASDSDRKIPEKPQGPNVLRKKRPPLAPGSPDLHGHKMPGDHHKHRSRG
ncbi:hypothetical protein DENSPDRAFT_84454 [Dentipellis sp. KUC8613]|nr:hypothetical protein DENSPDRAFT_84454 [Dentipellis sp. KUC8613]